MTAIVQKVPLPLNDEVVHRLLVGLTPTFGMSPDQVQKEHERVDAALLETGATAELHICPDDRPPKSTHPVPILGYYVEIYAANKTPIYRCSRNITPLTSVVKDLLRSAWMDLSSKC